MSEIPQEGKLRNAWIPMNFPCRLALRSRDNDLFFLFRSEVIWVRTRIKLLVTCLLFQPLGQSLPVFHSQCLRTHPSLKSTRSQNQLHLFSLANAASNSKLNPLARLPDCFRNVLHVPRPVGDRVPALMPYHACRASFTKLKQLLRSPRAIFVPDDVRREDVA